jgi:endonuclease YncB( thermonuclease family)
MPMIPAHRYAARILRIVDADTYEMDIDLGFHAHVFVPIRLRGIDTPERNTDQGVSAALYVTALLKDRELVVETYKDRQSFARWIGDVYLGDVLVADILRGQGYVKRGPM